MILNNSILPVHTRTVISNTVSTPSPHSVINLKSLPNFFNTPSAVLKFLMPVFSECYPHARLLSVGPHWLEVDKIGTCRGNGVSDLVVLSQTQVCVCVCGCGCGCGCVRAYIYNSVVCTDVWRHKPSNRASRAWLTCHKQAALVISKAVNIDYFKWLSHYTHKYTLITHPWLDILRFCFEKYKAISGSWNKQSFINPYLSLGGSFEK